MNNEHPDIQLLRRCCKRRPRSLAEMPNLRGLTAIARSTVSTMMNFDDESDKIRKGKD